MKDCIMFKNIGSKVVDFFSTESNEHNRFDSLIGIENVTKGDMDFKGHITLDGHVIGSVNGLCPRKHSSITIKGSITGGKQVSSNVIIVEGTVKAHTIIATDKLVVKKNGVVEGNISYGSLSVEDGALLNGSINKISKNPAAPKKKSVKKVEKTPEAV